MATAMVGISPWKSRVVSLSDAAWGYSIGLFLATLLLPELGVLLFILPTISSVFFATVNPGTKAVQTFAWLAIYVSGWSKQHWYVSRFNEVWKREKIDLGKTKTPMIEARKHSYLGETYTKMSSHIYLLGLDITILSVDIFMILQISPAPLTYSQLLSAGLIIAVIITVSFILELHDLPTKLRVVAILELIIVHKSREEIRINDIREQLKNGLWLDAKNTIQNELTYKRPT